MRCAITAILCLVIGVGVGYYYAHSDSKAIETLQAERESLLQQNNILLTENIKLKKRIDKNLEALQWTTNAIDSIKKQQAYERQSNANRIRTAITGTDAEKLDLWAGYAGEN